MTEIINGLFIWIVTTEYAQYASVLALVGYLLSHIIQYLPVSVTTKIPDIVMVLINLIAAKHGANLSASTGLSGNKILQVAKDE